jgi:predicted CopG family antitoxin
MAELKQVKLNAEVKAELDSLKYYENDSYSTVIKRLIEENKQLKEDKIQLYKMALRTEDSTALANNVHKATYFIANVIEDVGTAEEDKLQVLETYLNEMLVEDSSSVLTAIEILKDGASEETLEILTKFENYVRTSS